MLSPVLFTRYIRPILVNLVSAKIGCNIGGLFINVLAYADDIVVLAPAWRAMQILLDILYSQACLINMDCNVRKTVCMVFSPSNKRMKISFSFPVFNIGGLDIQFVNAFKYLGHIINSKFSDDDDIQREIRSLYMRVNIIARKFKYCSSTVKVILFRCYCICFYDVSIWARYSCGIMDKFRSSYIKCMKFFFGYSRRDSVTSMLISIGLPSIDTLLHNAVVSFNRQLLQCNNVIVKHLQLVNSTNLY